MVKNKNNKISIHHDIKIEDEQRYYILEKDIEARYSGNGEWMPFEESGYIGQSKNMCIVGKDSLISYQSTYSYIGFSISNNSGFINSPPSMIETSDSELPIIEGPSVLFGLKEYTAKGGTIIISKPGMTQNTDLLIYHSSYPFDKLLEIKTINFKVPAKAFADKELLLPYEIKFNLYPDSRSYVSGSMGSSETKDAKVFQIIDDPGLNRKSPTKLISVP